MLTENKHTTAVNLSKKSLVTVIKAEVLVEIKLVHP